MKKIIALMLTLVFVFAFNACLDLNEEKETTVAEGESTTSQFESDAAETTAAEPATDEYGSTLEATTGENGSSAAAETTTKHEKTTASAEQTGGSKAYAALSSGNFYMACTVTGEDGTQSPVVFASKGDDLRMDVTMKGSRIGIIIAGGKMTMIYDKYYAELDESSLSAFGVGSVEELVSSMGVGDGFAGDMFSGLTFSKSEKATFDGQSVTKYYYTKGSGSSEQTVLYETAEGKLLCMDNTDANGNVTQTMKFSDFKTEVPADAFSVSGYTQTDFFDIMYKMYTVIEGSNADS